MYLIKSKFCLLILLLSFAAQLQAQVIVVNKIFNSGTQAGAGDFVELLVIKDKLDIRGMYIKDINGKPGSESSYDDKGGKFMFSQNAIWSNLRAGTSIILRKIPADSTIVEDIDFTDRTIDIRINNNKTYLISVKDAEGKSGIFNVQNYDMIALLPAKKQGSNDGSADGFEVFIHAFVSGVNANYEAAYQALPNPKMGTSAILPTKNGTLQANSPTLTLADYTGFNHKMGNNIIINTMGSATNEAFINKIREK
jgi:hypothetical protein